MKRWIHASAYDDFDYPETVNDPNYVYPDMIEVELYPETHTWERYKKAYEHEGGGCYYWSIDPHPSVVTAQISLYPDGHLTYTWNARENLLNHPWRPVGSSLTASTDISCSNNQVLPQVQKIIDQIANTYQLLYSTPKDDYVLRGDSFAFKVNNHNVYRVCIDDETNELIFQCIAFAWLDDDGKEYYDEAVDYKDAVLEYDDMFDTIVKWVNECEADDPNYTQYEDAEGNPIEASTDTRERISNLEARIDRLTQYIDECKAEGCDLDEFVDEMAELEELKDQLNFAWQDDEAEYNYAVEQQEFNPDGSLKFYGSTKVIGFLA